MSDFLEMLVDNAVARITDLTFDTFVDDHIVCAEVHVTTKEGTKHTFDLPYIGDGIAHLMYFNDSIAARAEVQMMLRTAAEGVVEDYEEWADLDEWDRSFMELLTINGPSQFDEARQSVIANARLSAGQALLARLSAEVQVGDEVVITATRLSDPNGEGRVTRISDDGETVYITNVNQPFMGTYINEPFPRYRVIKR